MQCKFIFLKPRNQWEFRRRLSLSLENTRPIEKQVTPLDKAAATITITMTTMSMPSDAETEAAID